MKFPKNNLRGRKLRRGLSCLLAIAIVMLCSSNIVMVAKAMGKQEVKGYVKVDTLLNLRKNPNMDATIIGELLPGEIVTIVDMGDEKWTKVRTESGYEGYVVNDYLVVPGLDSEEYELISVAVITKTDGSSENRNFNMERAARYLNGLVVHSEDEFAWYSTDKTEGIVGPANKENGYKEAPIIVGGKSVMGYGGGVCQVSTALYNCIYKIDIVPTQHHHHSLASSYVQKGMDATVSYPNKNFVFTNTKEYAILFEAYTDGPQVVVVAYKIR